MATFIFRAQSRTAIPVAVKSVFSLSVALIGMLCMQPAQSATYAWRTTCGNGNWTDFGCWEIFSSVEPGINDTANLASAYTITSSSNNAANILQIWGNGRGLQTGGTMTNNYTRLGLSGSAGTYRLDAGIHNISNSLMLSYDTNSAGIYDMNGGALNVGGSAYVGLRSSSQTSLFNQSGGANSVSGSLYVGHDDGSRGVYNLTAGALSVANNINVGGTAPVSTAMGSLNVTGSTATASANNLTVWSDNSSITTGSTASTTGGIIDIAGALTLRGGGIATSYRGDVDSSYTGALSGIYAGSASISGTGTRWDTRYFNTGLSGAGTTTVSRGGVVRSVNNTIIGLYNGSNGTLNIDLGGTVVTNSNGYLGYNSGATGTVNVGGANALWDVGFTLFVGGNSSASGGGGTGVLNVNSRGTVLAENLVVWNGNSSVTTGGTASTIGGVIDIAGALTLQGGGNATSYYGRVDSSHSVNLLSGIYAGSASISGPDTRWDTRHFYTGFTGNGATTVYNGGSVSSSGYTLIGHDNGSNGMLNINAGGAVFTGLHGYLGFNSGATGTANVSGADALWDVANTLYVGGNVSGSGGAGTLNIDAGGAVNAGFFELYDTGVLNMNGGTLTAGGLDNLGSFNFNAGTVNVANDLATNGFGAQGSITVGTFGTLNVGGATSLNDFSTLVVNGGTFSTGSLIDNGGFAFNSGIFNLTSDNLVIGAGGLFGSNVEFDSSRTVNVSNSVNINSGAILGLNNTSFSAGTYNNSGTVDLVGSVTNASGGNFINAGLLTGNGAMSASLTNTSTGELRATSGDTLVMAGATNTNAGLINLLGGTVEFSNAVSNGATGMINGHGALIATGGLVNDGVIATTAVTDIQGNVTNVNSGNIIVAGTITTFYDDVVHNGADFIVKNGAQAVFFGSYSGASNFTGAGELVFAGDLLPGNSPALIDVTGDMTLMASNTTIIELGGLFRGDEYDAFDIGGTLSLGGELDVVMFDLGSGLFAPGLGDSFDLFAADTITGSFDLLTLAALGGGLDWQLDLLADEIGTTDILRLSVVSSVPVPPAVWLFVSGLLGLVGVSRRK